MAYWNPFGWSEETRRSIQSVVRPVMQVASMAASMGAFSGGGGAAKAGGAAGSGSAEGAAAITGTDPSSTFDIGMDLDLGTGANTFGESMVGPEAYTHDGSFTFDRNIQGTSFTGNTPGFMPASPVMSVPNNIKLQTSPFDPTGSQFNSNSDLQSLTPEPHVNLEATPLNPQQDAATRAAEAYSKGDMKTYDAELRKLGQGGEHMDLGDRSNWTQDDWNRHNQHREQYKDAPDYNEDPLYGKQVGGNQTVKPKPTQTTQQPAEVKPPETPNKPEVKPPKTEGPGPGGKEEKWSWDGKAFNWKNIEKFLKSKEGRQWLLMDEKGFAGIGRKLSAAADAGVSGTGGLTPEERKKIYARLKKEREERKKKRRGDDDK